MSIRTRVRPQHRVRADWRPLELQLLAARPLLPGDTIQQVFVSAAMHSPGLVAQGIQAWVEQYAFLVPIRALTNATFDDLAAMIRGDAPEPVVQQDRPELGIYTGMQAWVELAYERVCKDYFWHDKLPAQTGLGLRRATINPGTWLAAAIDAPQPPSLDRDSDGTTTAAEADAALREWWQQVMAGDQVEDYSDILRRSGIRINDDGETAGVELIGYLRRWIEPRDRLDTATGNVVSRWEHQERSALSTSRRLSREPSMLLVIGLVRPSVWPDWSRYGIAGNGSLTGADVDRVSNDWPLHLMPWSAATGRPVTDTGWSLHPYHALHLGESVTLPGATQGAVYAWASYEELIAPTPDVVCQACFGDPLAKVSYQAAYRLDIKTGARVPPVRLASLPRL